jgi:hypothetical protein
MWAHEHDVSPDPAGSVPARSDVQNPRAVGFGRFCTSRRIAGFEPLAARSGDVQNPRAVGLGRFCTSHNPRSVDVQNPRAVGFRRFCTSHIRLRTSHRGGRLDQTGGPVRRRQADRSTDSGPRTRSVPIGLVESSRLGVRAANDSFATVAAMRVGRVGLETAAGESPRLGRRSAQPAVVPTVGRTPGSRDGCAGRGQATE